MQHRTILQQFVGKPQKKRSSVECLLWATYWTIWPSDAPVIVQEFSGECGKVLGLAVTVYLNNELGPNHSHGLHHQCNTQTYITHNNTLFYFWCYTI